jgi:hypothetical protein
LDTESSPRDERTVAAPVMKPHRCLAGMRQVLDPELALAPERGQRRTRSRRVDRPNVADCFNTDVSHGVAG